MKQSAKLQAAFRLAAVWLAVAMFMVSSLPASAAPYAASDLLGQAGFTDIGANGQTDPNAVGLYEANGTAIDPIAHRLYVADAYNGRVLVYDLTVGNLLIDHTPDHVLGQPDFATNLHYVDQKGLSQPWAVAVDPSTARVFVADRLTHRVMVYDTTFLADYQFATYVLGQPDFLTDTPSTTRDGMDTPVALAFDVAGQRLFVSDKGNGRVLVFDATTLTTGKPADHVLGKGDFTSDGCGPASATELCGADQDYQQYLMGLAYDAAGQRLFVSDSGNSRILAYNVAAITDGEPAVSVLGQSTMSASGDNTGPAGLSDLALGLAYDPGAHRLFAADNTRILVFDVTAITDGEPAVKVLGQPDFTSQTIALTPGSVTSVNGLTYDPITSRLYAGDVGHSRILVFDVAAITNGEDAIDVLGHLDNDGNPRFDWTGASDLHIRPNGFDTPNDVLVDPVGHRLFVADNNNSRVVVYGLDAGNNISDRTATAVLGQSGLYDSTPATSQTGMASPNALAYDAARQWLFVADGTRVLIYDVTTISIGEPALYVLGQANFTATASPGLSSTALAYDSAHHRLYATDTSLNRVLVYDIEHPVNGQAASFVIGQPDMSTVSPGTSATKLSSPFGLAYDARHERLFVSDTSNFRVLVYPTAALHDGLAATRVLGQVDLTSAANDPVSASDINVPLTLSYDPVADQLFVTDAFTNLRVLVFDVAEVTNNEPAAAVLGRPDLTSAPSGYEVSQTAFGVNVGVHFDPTARHLLVTEWLSSRVLLFELIRLTTGALPSATVGSGYMGSLAATHGQGTQTFAVTGGGLPPGLALAANGFISGQPTASGTFAFTVTATDDNGAVGSFKDTKNLSITVLGAATTASTTPPSQVTKLKPASKPRFATVVAALPALSATPTPEASPSVTPSPDSRPTASSVPAPNPSSQLPPAARNVLGYAGVAGIVLVLLVLGASLIRRLRHRLSP